MNHPLNHDLNSRQTLKSPKPAQERSVGIDGGGGCYKLQAVVFIREQFR